MSILLRIATLTLLFATLKLLRLYTSVTTQRITITTYSFKPPLACRVSTVFNARYPELISLGITEYKN